MLPNVHPACQRLRLLLLRPIMQPSHTRTSFNHVASEQRIYWGEDRRPDRSCSYRIFRYMAICFAYHGCKSPHRFSVCYFPYASVPEDGEMGNSADDSEVSPRQTAGHQPSIGASTALYCLRVEIGIAQRFVSVSQESKEVMTACE